MMCCHCPTKNKQRVGHHAVAPKFNTLKPVRNGVAGQTCFQIMLQHFPTKTESNNPTRNIQNLYFSTEYDG